MAKKNNIFSILLSWWDQWGLFSLSLFFLAFIPLYPKIPVFSPIEQYIVRVRIEDFLVLGAVVSWLIQWWRGKIAWRNPVLVTMLAYFFVSLISVGLAIFILHTVPWQPVHIAKTLLHYFRYIEYFSLLLIFFSGIKNKQQLTAVLNILALTVVAIAIYGYGQKFFYWPVYSTMNREFSKGVRLYLTEHARVQSTFAGHYDLGGYLVIILPIILAAALLTQKPINKIFFHLAHWSGIWLLVVSASRTSFAAYLVSVWIVIGVIAWQKSKWSAKIKYAFTRLALVGIMLSFTMVWFGEDIYDRFIQLLEGYPQVNSTYHNLNAMRKDFTNKYVLVYFSDKSLVPTVQKPDNAISTDEAVRIIVSSDERPTTTRPGDVYEDIPDIVEVATKSADGTETTILVSQPRVFSENALKHGLSLAIRLDALWPQAIKGFQRNPLTGSGYATLNKLGYQHFTEADSTDNNFLRTLGETGLLGFITFYGSILLAIYLSVSLFKSEDVTNKILSIGYFAGSIGLLINATYIDVYAASKVAFTFWSVTGLLLAALAMDSKTKKSFNNLTKQIEKLTGPAKKIFLLKS